ncbi:MAG: hypothetical protein ACTH1D_07995 [Mycobacteriaceae bacterium]|uniref:hypothetical protein n=1 Tax=Corynebacterium sp. TaxID=1720 RepID=UPI003F94BB8B
MSNAPAAGTPDAPATATTTEDTSAEGRRGGLILLATGAVLTVVGAIVALVAGADATVAIRRSSEMNVWMILLPGVVGLLLGAYGYTVRKAYETKGASKSFIIVAVLVGLLFLRMAYSAFA